MSGTWAIDPWRRYPYRWFDGTTWTALVSDGTDQALDPYVVDVDLRASTHTPDAGTRTAAKPSLPPRSATAAAPSGARTVTTTAPATATAPAAATDRAAAVITGELPTTSVSSRRTDRAAGARGAGTGAATQPVWVPIIGLLMVAGVLWGLFHLRSGGDDGRAPSDATATEAVDTGPATGSTLEVVDTVAPTIPPPGTTLAATSATSAPPSQPSGSDPALAGLVDDCVAYTPFAAYVGDDAAGSLWAASGMDTEVLDDLCAALPVERLQEISLLRRQTDLFLTGSTATTEASTTGTSVVPLITSPDGATVPVSPTVPPTFPPTTV